MTVVEFHNEACEKQILHSDENLQRIYWLLQRLFDWKPSKTNQIYNIFDFSCFPIQYSNKKTNFRMIKLIIDFESWHWKLKLDIVLHLMVQKMYEKFFVDGH